MKTVYLNPDDTVREILPPEASPIEDFYSPEFCARCVHALDEVQQHWVYDPDTGTFSPPPTPEPPPLPSYEDLVQQYIHERYSVDDELALNALAVETLNSGGVLPQEYKEYRAYVQECKARAREKNDNVQ